MGQGAEYDFQDWVIKNLKAPSLLSLTGIVTQTARGQVFVVSE
jgi:hypothetical protein